MKKFTEKEIRFAIEKATMGEKLNHSITTGRIISRYPYMNRNILERELEL